MQLWSPVGCAQAPPHLLSEARHITSSPVSLRSTADTGVEVISNWWGCSCVIVLLVLWSLAKPETSFLYLGIVERLVEETITKRKIASVAIVVVPRINPAGEKLHCILLHCYLLGCIPSLSTTFDTSRPTPVTPASFFQPMFGYDVTSQ